MEDRQKLNNGKSSIIKTPTLPSDYAGFKAAMEAGLFVDISANNNPGEGVTVIGTALNKANLLTDAVAERLGLGTSATPNDALNAIADNLLAREGTLVSNSWTAGTGYYYQDISLTGITANSELIVGLNMSSSLYTYAKQIIKCFGYIYSAEPMNGYIRFYATSLPTINLPITVRGK